MNRASKLLLPLAAVVLLGASANASAQKSEWIIDGGARLVSAEDGRCLGVQGAVAPGNPVAILPCDGSAAQVFEHVGDRIKVGGLCMVLVTNDVVKDVAVANCNDDPKQLWVRDSQRALRAVGTPLCVWNGGGNGPIKTEPCYDVPGQRWNAVTP